MATKQKLKVGDKIVCIADSYKDFTKGKEYEIFNIDSNYIMVLNDYGEPINFLSLHNTFKLKEEKESVNHPSHYGGENNPLEVINIIEHYDLNFNLGNVIKYCLRAGKKDELIQELKKAQWYINREIQRLEK
jgi:hypothetical protein